jgi:hypothetical protein
MKTSHSLPEGHKQFQTLQLLSGPLTDWHSRH